jgi:radical SAM superfamily enzyme YgiQ (UPF0313 family)
MECDLLLINPPLSMEKRYGDFAELGSKVPPLGLCMIAAVVRKAGFTAKIIDAAALNIHLRETIALVKKEKPRFVGVTAVTNSISTAYSLIDNLKSQSVTSKAIIGGPHITALPEETFRECENLDIGVIGEGDITIVEILSGKSLHEVNGIIFREDGEVYRTPHREYIQELDTLPFPAWDLLPQVQKYYRPSPHMYLKLPSSSLLTSRGCPGKCSFCVMALSGGKFRAHSADYTVGMVEHLIKNYHVRDIIFYDDNFLLDKKRAIEICEQIIKKEFNITWSCLARPEMISKDILKLIKKSGCWQIAYGIESGDQRILDTLKKNSQLEKAEEVLRQTVEVGIRTRGFFMLGVPGETEESIIKTIDFAKRSYLNDFQVTFFTPFPGTELFQNIHQYGDYKRDWDSMNTWAPVFIPTGLTHEKLVKYHRKMHREFYFRPKIILQYAVRLIANPAPFLHSLRAGIQLFMYSFLGVKRRKDLG